MINLLRFRQNHLWLNATFFRIYLSQTRILFRAQTCLFTWLRFKNLRKNKIFRTTMGCCLAIELEAARDRAKKRIIRRRYGALAGVRAYPQQQNQYYFNFNQGHRSQPVLLPAQHFHHHHRHHHHGIHHHGHHNALNPGHHHTHHHAHHHSHHHHGHH